MYYVYVIKNNDNGRHYIGYASDLDGRLKEHSYGKIKSLRNIKNFSLIYQEEYETKEKAYRRENKLKATKVVMPLKNY